MKKEINLYSLAEIKNTTSLSPRSRGKGLRALYLLKPRFWDYTVCVDDVVVVVEISTKQWTHTNITKAKDNSNFVFHESQTLSHILRGTELSDAYARER